MLDIIALLASFTVIFALIFRKQNVGVSLLLGSLILGIFTIPPLELARTISEAVIDRATIELTAAVVLITFLGYSYQRTGMLEELTESLSGVLSDPRSLAAVVPALFGLLPTLGGALMSAPFVNTVGEDLGMSAERKTFVNLWYRHVIFFAYPMGTTLLTASFLTKVSVNDLIIYQLPVLFVSTFVGYWLGLRQIKAARKAVKSGKKSVISLAKSISPIALVLALSLVLKVTIPLAVAVGVVLLYIIARAGLGIARQVAGEARLHTMAVTVIGIMIYRHVIESSGIINKIAPAFHSARVPPIALLMLVPTLFGFILGTPMGAISVSVPVLSAITNLGGAQTSLLHACALLSYIWSPLHLCFTLTSDYFGASSAKVYRFLAPAVITTMIAAGAAIPLLYVALG